MGDKGASLKIIAGLALFLLAAAFLFRGRDYTRETLNLDAEISGVMEKYGIGEAELRYEKKERRKDGRHLFLKIERHYAAGAAFDADGLRADVKEFLKGTRFALAKWAVEATRST